MKLLRLETDRLDCTSTARRLFEVLWLEIHPTMIGMKPQLHHTTFEQYTKQYVTYKNQRQLLLPSHCCSNKLLNSSCCCSKRW